MKPINETAYYPVFERPDKIIGVGIGYSTFDEAIDCLVLRDDTLIQPDTRQWAKKETTEYVEIFSRDRA